MELDIAGLETTGRDELLEHWRCLIGRPPPKHISRSLLIQILAWEQQSGLYGGFTKRLSLRLTRAGLRDVMRPAFKPGSRFVREYHGKTHVVEVAEDGWFVWNVQRFKSLSHTARAVTKLDTSEKRGSNVIAYRQKRPQMGEWGRWGSYKLQHRKKYNHMINIDKMCQSRKLAFCKAF